MEEMKNAYRIFVGKPVKARDHLEDLGLDGRIIKWILRKYIARVWTAFMWSRIATPRRAFVNTGMNIEVP
jgi:hypothetical protein